MKEPKKYRKFDGIEYYLTRITDTKKEAEDEVEWWKRDIKFFYPQGWKFPFKAKIIKRKGKYYVYLNNTVHNVNYWERTGELPKD